MSQPFTAAGAGARCDGFECDRKGVWGGVRVLIVDDEADYRYLMVLGLSVEGHEVFDADDAFGACRLAAKVKPEVILVDLVLVGESGMGLLPRLRQAAPEAAVVLHTVERERAAVMVGHPSGPDGLLEKGIPPRQLSEALAGIVALHRARNGSHEHQ